MRFSLAHELAHTFFYDRSKERPEVQKSFRAGGRKTALEILERHCNRIAAHLLLPTPMIKSWILKRRSMDPCALLSLSKEAGVSIEALIHRLNEIRSVFVDLSFYGCVVLVSTENGASKVLAIAKPRNMNIALELEQLKTGELWKFETKRGTKLEPEELLSLSEIELTHRTQLSSTLQKYRVEAQQVSLLGRPNVILAQLQVAS